MYFEVSSIVGEAPLHNLLASAVKLDADDANRWEAGITWAQEGCVEAISYESICSDEGIDLSEVPAGTELATMLADTHYLPFECYAISASELDQGQKDRMISRLEIAAIKSAENSFWNGVLVGMTSETPTVSGDAGVISASAVTPEVALVSLAQALANCGSGARGMIHAVPYLVETWAARNYLCEGDDGRLRTRGRGDIVVAGSGYTGVGPEGHASSDPPDGQAWAYATSMVGYRESDVYFDTVEPSEIVSRSNNVVRWVAKKTIGFQVDTGCCLFAALVDVP